MRKKRIATGTLIAATAVLPMSLAPASAQVATSAGSPGTVITQPYGFLKDVGKGAAQGAAGGCLAGLPEGGIGCAPGAGVGAIGGAASGAIGWAADKLFGD